MMESMRNLSICLIAIILTGCGIPYQKASESVSLNNKASSIAIIALQQQIDDVIHAFADDERSFLANNLTTVRNQADNALCGGVADGARVACQTNLRSAIDARAEKRKNEILISIKKAEEDLITRSRNNALEAIGTSSSTFSYFIANQTYEEALNYLSNREKDIGIMKKLDLKQLIGISGVCINNVNNCIN